MMAILGTVLLFAAAVMEVLLIFGLPLGEFTMGGRYKVLPPALRIAAASSILLQIFGALILLQGAGFMKMWFGETPTRIICYVYGGFFALNTVMNLISPSKKEKLVMTPLAAIESACFIITAIMI